MLWKGFQRPKRIEVDRDTLTPTFGRFIAQPFERGFGTTVGNAMRRCLLSSIDGAAVTAVQIEGVLHEFSAMPGVVEDVTDIILNLKQVPIRLHSEEPKVLSLEADLYERNPSTLEAAWREFSVGVYRLENELMVVLDVAKLLDMRRAEAA